MIAGPTSDATTMNTTTNIPKTASLFRSNRRQAFCHNEVPASTSIAGICSVAIALELTSLVPDAWIDKAVRDIHHKVEKQDRNRSKCDDADDQRFVSIQVGIDEIVAHSRQGKNSFNHNGARDQERQRRSAEGDHG